MFTQRKFIGAAVAVLLTLGVLAPIGSAAAQSDQFTTEEVPDHQVAFPTFDKVVGINPQIDSLWLVDTDADTLIAEISAGQVFDRNALPPNLSIVASANDDTESVQFGYGGAIATHVENVAPYAIGGDNGGDYNPYALPDGWHTIRARPFAADNASGSYGDEILLTFGIFVETIVVDTTQDGHDDDPGDGLCLSRPGGGIDDFQQKSPEPDDAKRTTENVIATRTVTSAPDAYAVTAESNDDSRTEMFQLAGKCTLRAAIEEANARAGQQRIEVPDLFGSVYTIPLGTLDVTDTVVIESDGLVTIDAEDGHRTMHIEDAGEVVLSRLRLLNGDARSCCSGSGGNLRIDDSTVEVLDSQIRGGLGTNGGGIFIESGELVVRRSIIAGNHAGDPTHMSGNIGGVNQWGGGIYSQNSDIVIDTTSIHDNGAVRGAGVTIAGGFESFITNSAIIENTAFQQGSGLAVRSASSGEPRVHMAWTTVAYNSGVYGASSDYLASGGGIWVMAGELIMGNSVVAENTVALSELSDDYGPDCWVDDNAAFTSYRGNIVGQVTDSCALLDSHFGDLLPHDLVGDADQPFDAELGTVSFSWRPSVLPMPGSAAVDHGPNNQGLAFFGPCPETDVRGQPRPANDSLCDIGSAERQ
ncbi:MAG: choice-of-anchor Q domain-containing protein [Acidimicrobiales bacterium]